MRSESGRSLVEMMGTLAIMGILAIAGIWMYNSAMDKLKANTIINEAQKRAVVVAGQIGFQGRTNPSLEEFSDNTFSGGTFSTDVVTSGLYGQFGIQVSGVSKNVCQNILNSIGEGTAIRRLSPIGNPQTSFKSCQDENTFLIVYNNDVSPTEGDVIYCDNSICQTVCGQCVSEDGQNKCVNECPSTGNTCSSNTDCQGECVGCVIPSGQSQGTCQACTRVEYLESTGTQHIDTGYVLTDDSVIEVEAQSTDVTQLDTNVCGVGSSATSTDRVQVHWNTSQTGVITCRIDGTMSSGTNVQTDKFKVEINIPERKAYINGDLAISNASQSINKSLTFSLFARHLNSGYAYRSKVKMYTFKVANNDSLVRDFIPVHAPFQPAGKQNCMFDRVSGQLFCNAATGNDFKTNLSN